MKRRLVVAAILITTTVSAGYLWGRERRWTVRSTDGRAACRVRSDWTESDVAARCGARTGRGCVIKAFAPGPDGLLDIRGCSPPGAVYGDKAILYGCDGRVSSVEDMPVPQFAYPCDPTK
jgi:hypothetical protein